MKIIVTGGCGFIGHHLVQHLYKTTDWDIVIIDKLSYASRGFDRLRDINLYGDKRITVLTVDIKYDLDKGIIHEIGDDVDYIVHMAAETHVDNSIENPRNCITNNVESTITMLQYAKTLPSLKKFIYFSTDEVFGPALNDTLYKEWDRHFPTNPYSASKSAGEQIALSYLNTYKVPILICNAMNVFGERQHIEKYIPLCIKKVLEDDTVIIHSYPECKKAGSRFYIHARNVAAAVMFLLDNGEIGDKYNITGEMEVTNLEMAQFIANTLGKELKYEMVDFHSTRPGHDLRYGLDGSKMKDMGWKLPVNFYDSLSKMILWTKDHPEWLDN
jgi:dTDP-glucose 4,6-dehydratase